MSEVANDVTDVGDARRDKSVAIVKQLILPIVLLLGGVALSLIYWPGLVTYDATRQYGQALSGAFDDWHPPMMEWIWRNLIHVYPGPAPMLVMQLFLYAAGVLALVLWAILRAQPRLAIAFSACTLMPLPAALMGEVLKDCLMAAALTAATGLALLGEQHKRQLLRIASVLLVFFAASLRFNGFLAGVPLLLLAAGPSSWKTPLRLALSSAIGAVALLCTMPLANWLIGASRSDVEMSLVIFDLAGITTRSGQDVFPTLGQANTAKIIGQCYSPVKWDTFSWWVEPLCPIDFDRVRTAFHRQGLNPYTYLTRQITSHPLAYTQHRLAHFNVSTRFMVRDEIERPLPRASAPNDWGFVIMDGPSLAVIDRAAVAQGSGPLGWPCTWLSLALALFFTAGRLPSAVPIRLLAGSALLYGFGYVVFGVASELRYYLWTMIATSFALVLMLSEMGILAKRQRWLRGLILVGSFATVAVAAMMARA
jgi:hypothetical protein